MSLKCIFINQDRNNYNSQISARQHVCLFPEHKNCALEFDKRLESIFCLLIILEESLLQEVVKMLEEAVVSLQEFW